jgi:hypothetical protein
MKIAACLFAALVALIPAQTLAGAPTVRIVVNGPEISAKGVTVTGVWPGWLTFVDFKSGAVPEPDPTLPRYLLSGYAGLASEGDLWYKITYVWDQSSNRALVYLPGPREDYYRENYAQNTAYAEVAGKWYPVLNEDPFKGWAELIRKALPHKGAH